MPQAKTMKLTKQMEEFYNKLNSFVEDFIVGGFDPEEWNQDEFKKCFVENMPKKKSSAQTFFEEVTIFAPEANTAAG